MHRAFGALLLQPLLLQMLLELLLLVQLLLLLLRLQLLHKMLQLLLLLLLLLGDCLLLLFLQLPCCCNCFSWLRAAHGLEWQIHFFTQAALLRLSCARIRPAFRSCWLAGILPPLAGTHWLLSSSQMVGEGWQEKPKCCTPPGVLRTTFPNLARQHTPDIAVACWRRLGPRREQP
jgi:hypothetical protein